MPVDKRGNNVCYCSFCGRSSTEAGKMLEKSDKHPGNKRHVLICLQCAAEAVEILSSANPPDHQG
jgi:ClpX C4-type zinc finger